MDDDQSELDWVRHHLEKLIGRRLLGSLTIPEDGLYQHYLDQETRLLRERRHVVHTGPVAVQA
jgi:hypothetical protein